MAVITLFLGVSAFAAYILAEYIFHIYDKTPIDRFTHGLSGMAITAFILNFNVTRSRKVCYPISTAFSWLDFILCSFMSGYLFESRSPLGL